MKSRFSRALTSAAVVLGAMTGAARADAANEVSFCKFTDGNQQTLALNGALALTDLVNLTPNLPNRAGSAWVRTPMSLTPTTSFAAHFRFRLYPNSDGTGGAGLAFVLQNKGLNAGSGSGGGLGLNGVSPSLAVELDTASDTQGDPNANHVAVIQDGKASVHLASGTPGFNLKSGISTDAWVDYDALAKTMSVFVSQGTGLKPALPLFSHVVDVYAAVKAGQHDNKVIVGFSAATGNTETNTQDVTYLVIATGSLTVPPLVDCIPCLSDVQCPANTPACQPNGFCGQCSTMNTSQCNGNTPVCNTNVGQCVECTSSAQCSGNEPVCVENVCAPCSANNGSGDPAQCPSGTAPVCQTQGPTSGSCTQCGPGELNLCSPTRPICLPEVGSCGCVNDADCGGATSGLICSGTPGVCVPGCRAAGGNACPQGQTCTIANGAQTGTCTQPCVDGCAGATPQCNTTTNQCVQCLTSADCQGGLLCNPTTNVCVECIPAVDETKCKVEETGDVCRPGGQCGCATDADCGNATSGRVCDDTNKVCRSGCRGVSGNGCKQGDVCTSQTTAIGQCVVDQGVDAGPDAGTDGGADAGARDAGRDAGGGVTSDAGTGRSDAGDGGGAAEDPALDDFSIEGGGCACNTLGASSPALSFGTFGLTAAALAALARRRRRR